MPTFELSDAEHRRSLALVRRMELRPGGMVWSALLDALETDRPRREEPVALASRRAPEVSGFHERLYGQADHLMKARKEGAL
jgi:hypothetical protein